VDEPQVELRRRLEAQVRERREEAVVAVPGRHRDVHPVEWPIETRSQRVRDLDHAAQIRGHVPWPRLVVSEAEVEPKLDIRRNEPA
jgi:hypothetical protein